MATFTILLGGDLVPTARLREQVAGTRVIAADSGMRHARALGVTPELWVGDFDSSDAPLLGAHADIARLDFPAEKDKTDGEIAVDMARERGASALVLAGAFGGPRPDHAFLHMALAIRLAEAGVPAVLSSGLQEGEPLLRGRRACCYADGTLFSILCFSDLSGLTVTGAKWPLDAVEVPFGSSLTLSNAVAGRLGITLKAGRALLLAHLAQS